VIRLVRDRSIEHDQSNVKHVLDYLAELVLHYLDECQLVDFI